MANSAITGRNELKHWLALKLVNGLGPVGINNLVEAFGKPHRIFERSMDELRAVPDISSKVASRISHFDKWPAVDKELQKAHRQGISILTPSDDSYPRQLLNVYDYPSILYVKGSLASKSVNVAVVGSRAASTYGKFITERLCRELAYNGVTVVSGMARGIDSAAHRGALTAKGRTIAVLGTGIDIIYPPENSKLYNDIAESGAVITEYAFGVPPLAANFPLRNRIISGLSLGVVVVEANEKSGSLITARLALEQGRDVFAVPGNIDTPGSRGTNWLIKNGAKLVESADDIIEEILPQIEFQGENCSNTQNTTNRWISAQENAESDDSRIILDILGEEPMNIDTLAERSGFDVQSLSSMLVCLEIEGYIEKIPGMLYKAR